MGEKSEQKKQLILETARRIFMEKGYKDVTMKDIVDACQISRGGLYLYFSGTQELFRAVMDADEAEADDVFSGAVPEDATAADVLLLFLKEQKKEILRRKDDLSLAAYEYYFAHGADQEKNPQRDPKRRVLRGGCEGGGQQYHVRAGRAAHQRAHHGRYGEDGG